MPLMTDETIRRAWREESPPSGCDPVPFLLLRAVYREYKKGLINELCKWFSSQNMVILILQPNRATLRSDPTPAVR